LNNIKKKTFFSGFKRDWTRSVMFSSRITSQPWKEQIY